MKRNINLAKFKKVAGSIALSTVLCLSGIAVFAGSARKEGYYNGVRYEVNATCYSSYGTGNATYVDTSKGIALKASFWGRTSRGLENSTASAGGTTYVTVTTSSLNVITPYDSDVTVYLDLGGVRVSEVRAAY